MKEERRLEELNQWADSLDESEIGYLSEEARRNLSTEQQNYSALDARVVAIVGWALVGVGTLLVAGDIQFDQSSRGLAATSVVVGASIVVLAGVYALWPRAWASGLDLDWYRQYEWDFLKQMQARGLVGMILGSELNQATLRKRNLATQLAAVGLLIEFGSLIARLVLPASSV